MELTVQCQSSLLLVRVYFDLPRVVLLPCPRDQGLDIRRDRRLVRGGDLCAQVQAGERRDAQSRIHSAEELGCWSEIGIDLIIKSEVVEYKADINWDSSCQSSLDSSSSESCLSDGQITDAI